MKRIILAILILVSSFVHAQTSAVITDRALGVNPFTPGTNGVPSPIFLSYAQVRVCNMPASGSPCSPVASITDPFGNPLSIIGGNFGQLTSDVVGRFYFGCSPGNYEIQIAATGSNTPQSQYYVSCPSTQSLSFSAITSGVNTQMQATIAAVPAFNGTTYTTNRFTISGYFGQNLPSYPAGFNTAPEALISLVGNPYTGNAGWELCSYGVQASLTAFQPDTCIGAGFFTRASIIISGVTSGSGTQYIFKQPTADGTMLGIWPDVPQAIVIRQTPWTNANQLAMLFASDWGVGNQTITCNGTTTCGYSGGMTSDMDMFWNARSNTSPTTFDTSFGRLSAGVLYVGTGGIGSTAGELRAGKLNACVIGGVSYVGSGALYTGCWGSSDIGAQINAAVTACASTGTCYIRIQQGAFNTSTAIQFPINTYTKSVVLEGVAETGDQGTGSSTLSDTAPTILNWTGTGTFIDQTFSNVSFQNARGAVIRNLTINCSSCGAGSIGIQFSGTENFTLQNVALTNFAGAGDVGVKLVNNTATMFTERWYFSHLLLANNTIGLQFNKGGGAVSFAHGIGLIYLSDFGGQTGISLVGGASIQSSNLTVNGNFQGTSCNGIAVDATSTTGGGTTFLHWGAEMVSGSCSRFNVAGGGIFDMSGFFGTTGGQTDTGTVTLEGNNNGTWNFTAAAQTPSLTIVNNGLLNLVAGASLQMSATKTIVNTAPTISSGFGTTPSVVNSNGTAAFTINVGTGGTATSGVVGLPSAANGWACTAIDRSTNIVTRETATTLTTVTLTAASAWTASDILQITCMGY